MSRTVVLVDLSNLLHRSFAMKKDDGDVNSTATDVVAQVRRLAHGQPNVAIACDSGPSFRKQISDSYKANRGERDPSIYHQMKKACTRLAEDGFPIWSVKDFEADDVIATATMRALATDDETQVLLVTSDKDLYSLIGPRVQIKRPDTGELVDEAGVVAKFGIRADQVRDYLTLVGDASDNIRGAEKVGPKTAAALLQQFGTLEEMYRDFNAATATQRQALGFKPGLIKSLEEFAPRVDEVRQLVTLRTDVEIPFDDVFATRVTKAAKEFNPDRYSDDESGAESGEEAMLEQEQPQGQNVEPSPAAMVVATPEQQQPRPEPQPAAPMALVRSGTVLPALPYERQLDPRNSKELMLMAADFFEAAMFDGYGSPQAIATTVMLGRELGMPAMASLRQIHNIDGRHALSAQLMVALVLKSGFAEFFTPVKFDEKAATFKTWRKGQPDPIELTHTIEMAQAAFFGNREPDEKALTAWNKSGWGKNPVDMLVARASSRLCRMVYRTWSAGSTRLRNCARSATRSVERRERDSSSGPVLRRRRLVHRPAPCRRRPRCAPGSDGGQSLESRRRHPRRQSP
jgi:5'-3' exonuclease